MHLCKFKTNLNLTLFNTELDFFNADVTANNLGGKGPDLSAEEEIRFSGVGVYKDDKFDLVVTSTSDYTPKSSNENGQNGRFGQINLAVGSSVSLTFSLRDAANRPLQLNSFYFSFLDIDEGQNNHERVCINDGLYREYRVAQETKEVEVIKSSWTCEGDQNLGSTSFVSTRRGYERFLSSSFSWSA